MQIKSGPRSKNAELPAQGNEITMSIPKNCLIRLQPQKNLPLPAGLPRIHHYKVFSLKAQARHSDAAVRQLPLPHPTAERAALKTHCACARACRSGDCLLSYPFEFTLFFAKPVSPHAKAQTRKKGICTRFSMQLFPRIKKGLRTRKPKTATETLKKTQPD
jgi:hypothetical protein